MDVLLTVPDPGLRRLHRGKVREMFELDADRLLMVATDRLSAFDVVFPQGIPGKGRVLTQLSALWFGATRHIVANHLVSDDLGGLGLPGDVRRLLEGRSLVVRRARRSTSSAWCGGTWPDRAGRSTRPPARSAGYPSRRGSGSPAGCRSPSSRRP
ncbi:phosphoribosylaminoimidazolesuccinocarboxamide synthase [Symbiobacterium thermophilum]|uniref:phosphoribosylaminoimidazolesuccinocarboxamide synthase n=1 Tax=Symbiobacterium thermophilum TaxID=2734 RepID=UPI0035C6E070